MLDPLANAMSTIANAEILGRKEVTIKPASRIIANVLRVIQKYGAIGEFEVMEDLWIISVQLLGRITKIGVIKPRYPVRVKDYVEWEKRFLPARDMVLIPDGRQCMANLTDITTGVITCPAGHHLLHLCQDFTGDEFNVFIRDISKRKALEEKQEEINKQLASKAEQLLFQQNALDEHAIVSITDVKGNITYVNDKFVQISQYTSDELVGENHRILKSNEHAAQFFKEMWQTIAKGKVWHGEICNTAKDGTHYWVYSTIVPFLEKGKPTQYISMRTDITYRKQIEAKQQAQTNLIAMINDAQTVYINEHDPVVLFNSFLPKILSLLDSEYGLIAEALHDGEGNPYIKAYAATDISWDDATHEFYDQNASTGIEFHELNNLFGHVITSGEVVISNDPTNDPRSKGLPPGHPALNAFLGVPIYVDEQLKGMLGFANRKGGYDEKVIDNLQPILSMCAQLLDAIGKDRIQGQKGHLSAMGRQGCSALRSLQHHGRLPQRQCRFKLCRFR